MTFHHLPVLNLSMPQFLEQARDRIPTLAGLKFTNADLMSYQLRLRADDGAWDVPYGLDEHALGALAMGARGAVGSGYNFAAPIYLRLIAAFERGDLPAAREEQFRGVRLIQTFVRYGYMAAAKATTSMLGANVGPPGSLSTPYPKTKRRRCAANSRRWDSSTGSRREMLP